MADIPTDKDWRSEVWCLDVPYAYEHFFGKSIDEAVKLFENNALTYQEDLMFMPAACFRYYLRAYTQYLLSDACRGDSDGASCFFGLIEVRHVEIAGCDDETRSQVDAVLDRLASSQEWFDADEEIYGDFRSEAERARELLR